MLEVGPICGCRCVVGCAGRPAGIARLDPEPERAVVPVPHDGEIGVDLLPPGGVLGAFEERRERVVVTGRPRVAREEPLQQLLHRSERVERQRADDRGEPGDGVAGEPALHDLGASGIEVGTRPAHPDDGTGSSADAAPAYVALQTLSGCDAHSRTGNW